MSLTIQRQTHPRLFHPVDDGEYRFDPPADPERQRILANVVADCEAFARRRPWQRLPERLDSPHPFHQLYITFYSAMQATALIEHYAFAWRLTRDERWLGQARAWLLAASRWQHGDRIEEHFYTSNRYMQAFALALDLLSGHLGPDDEEEATACLVGLMERWWPEVEAQRLSAAAGHHAVVDNGHFGVAALHLLGKHPGAEAWVEAVIERFRAAIMPLGCGRHGDPLDGPSFWPWENLWMLHFADALRNVTGVDLYREFPQRLKKPLIWFRYHLIAPDQALGAGRREAWSPTLLRLSQEARDPELRAVALSDPDLGRIYRFHAGVKGSSAECLIAYGPYAYCYLDPEFSAATRTVGSRGASGVPHPRHGARLELTGPRSQRGGKELPLSRRFSGDSREVVALRSAWHDRALVAHVGGYAGRLANGFSDLQICWHGHPLLQAIACEEAQPLSCGSLPCVGGQNEILLMPESLTCTADVDRLRARSLRTDLEYWLLRGSPPVLLVAVRRRRRGYRLAREAGSTCARLNGRDYLQYPRQEHFSPRAGEVRMRVRLRRDVEPQRPQILWGTGMGVPGSMGTQVNTFALGFFGGEGLAFAVQSQRYHTAEVRIPPQQASLSPGAWHDVTARWGGLNDPKGRPFIELEVDGCRRRCDDPGLFGELGRNSQNLASRTTPRTFIVHPNTALGFGSAVQMPGTGVACDLARIDLRCPGRTPLEVDFSDGAGGESGSGSLVWKLNPVDLRKVYRRKARLGAGSRALDMLIASPGAAQLELEDVPFAPSGLAAGSLKRLNGTKDGPSTRVLATAGSSDHLVLAFAPANARAGLHHQETGFVLEAGDRRCVFEVCTSGRAVLKQT